MNEASAGTPANDDLTGFAAAIAPLVDHLRLSVMQAALRQGMPELLAVTGLDRTSGMMLAYLRNIYPDRVVPRSAVRSVFTYQPDKPVDAELDALLAQDVVEEPGPGTILLTRTGRQFLEEFHRVSDDVARSLWVGAESAIVAAGPLVDRVLGASWDTGGETFRLMAPDRLPASMSETGLLAERLTGLRFHRFDAHIASWRAAGYEVGDLPSLAEAERDAIEADTNRRAAVPYAGLTEGERAELLRGLQALAEATPGDGH